MFVSKEDYLFIKIPGPIPYRIDSIKGCFITFAISINRGSTIITKKALEKEKVVYTNLWSPLHFVIE